ncbi:hypothetical protein F4V91_25430 [Neorhizobium galegae]|uniref:Hydrogenase assembly protein HupF n=1 Tax=Neorhizobium galegae TaxID=399 RepID=A0A6A1TG53_NEOGA|nr:hypothetical protein [Neorhizobium galegae]KAB1083003.1 hypothetical protein F4V91_25430 [Neorhizobium galegae]
MSLFGTLGIDVIFKPGAAAAVHITAPRSAPATELLRGCTPAEMANRARLLFALCGNAHATAAISAAEAAMQSVPSTQARRARLQMVAAEALCEHFFRVVVDWPAFLSEAPRTHALQRVADQVAQIKARMGSRLYWSGVEAQAMPHGELAAVLARSVLSEVFGDDDAPLDSPSSIDAWTHKAATPAARMLAHARQDEAQPLDEYPEQTVFGRWRNDPRLNGSEAAQRVLSRLLEIDTLGRGLADENYCEGACKLTVNVNDGDGRIASAAIDVARGRLHHHIEIHDGKVTHCSISSPTGRNFEQGGAAEQAICRIRTASRTSFERQARLLVMEIDPCVAYELRFH